MKNVMLDLETMGNSSNAAIIAIGAVEFDIENKSIGKKFYQVVDLESSVKIGGVIDASTVLWWMKQSEDSRKEFEKKGCDIAFSLQSFSSWIKGVGEKGSVDVWGNGAVFDNVILSNTYKRLGLDVPWEFWNDRCYRTVKSLYPDVWLERVGTYHNALHDAESQAIHLIKMIGK